MNHSDLLGYICDCRTGELICRDPLGEVPVDLEAVPPQDFIIFLTGEERAGKEPVCFPAHIVQRLQAMAGEVPDDETVRQLMASGMLAPEYGELLKAHRFLAKRVDLTVL